MCIVNVCFVGFFFFKQKTAYERRMSEWSSDVCCSDLADLPHLPQAVENLADGIGPGRNGNGLERSELAHAAGVVKDLVEGVDLFGAKISDQGVGSLLAGTRASRTTGAFDGGDGRQ